MRFSMVTTCEGQGIEYGVIFTQMNSTSLLRLDFTQILQPENEYLEDCVNHDYEEEYSEDFPENIEDIMASEICLSYMPHLYIIKDVSCCLDPKQYQCNSVDGMKLQCIGRR